MEEQHSKNHVLAVVLLSAAVVLGTLFFGFLVYTFGVEIAIFLTIGVPTGTGFLLWTLAGHMGIEEDEPDISRL